ncbi:carboxymuconolactone decarboxylase family protein [Proteobacteria bacterium 005FR1]|nr:carboxymuconolactone decarboxylase family protein [Proteobacteria bacterium 005FR1]
MKERITRQQVFALQPALPRALLTLAEASKQTLEPLLVHLVELRASQLNRCAFCLNMHAHEARRSGERQARLDLLAGWRDAPCFSDRERAALAWCEALTCLPSETVGSADYEQLAAQFSHQEIVDLTSIVIVINGWNRLVAGMHFVPELSESEIPQCN